MKILFLTQFFDPEPTPKGLLFARQLVKAGHEVEVITGFPNYPGGQVYRGYTIRLRQIEVLDGVKVIRLPLYPSHSGSKVGRILNYLTFATSALIYGLLFTRRADVIYVYHPPLTVAVVGSLIGMLRRTPFVLDVQDMWPDTLRATGMVSSKRVLALIAKVCKFTYRRASRIVVLSPGFKGLLLDRGVEERKISIIYNWCDEGMFSSVSTGSANPLPPGFNVLFAGNMGKAQRLDVVLDAAELTHGRGISANFVFVGDGVELSDLVARAKERSQQNVHFLPRVSINEISLYLKHADALLVHLRRDPLFEVTVPSKIQAYLAAGRPVIVGVAGDAAKLIKDANAGVCCKPEDPQSLADAVEKLANLPCEALVSLGNNGNEFYNSNLSAAVGSGKFLDLFEEVKSESVSKDGETGS